MSADTTTALGAIEAVKELVQNSKRNKDRHFVAAERKLRYHVWCGIPAILINVFIASVLVKFQTSSGPKEQIPSDTWLSAVSIFLAFSGASLSSVQTFFNFHKSAEGHRAIANRYLGIAIEGRHLLLRHQDTSLTSKTFWDEVTKLRTKYERTNAEAEAFPTNRTDYQKALSHESKERKPEA